ncbi:MAG TPA: GDSL-type esterase/lipase family protein [Defluviitaleaceae bacterium]|nr:GDSL-type esterase/lipase family protein [Defluviitaleaceae bacterium]
MFFIKTYYTERRVITIRQWITSWGYLPIKFSLDCGDSKGKIQRAFTKNNVRGDQIRILFSNLHGKDPLHFKCVKIAKTSQLSNSAPYSFIPLSFNNKQELFLKPEECVYSDVIEFKVNEGEFIVIEIHTNNLPSILSGTFFYKDQHITSVFELSERTQNQFMQQILSDHENAYLYGFFQIEVNTQDDVKTIICFGDSITHDSKWTAPLAQNLYSKYPTKVSLINYGISGNRLLFDSEPSYFFGDAGVKRFEKDVFGNNKGDLVIVLEGINDIVHPLTGTAPLSEKISSQDIIEGLKILIEQAHSHNTKIILGTITPFYNYQSCWTKTENEKRNIINEWIRNSSEHDGYIDFDKIVRDPQDPKRLYYEYDKGDNLHLSKKGGQKVADSVDLEWLMQLCN